MVKLKRCAGLTKKGERCKNLARSGKFCHLHGTDTKFNQIERGINLVGGVAGVATGIYQVVEFVTHNWPTIVSITGWTNAHKHDAGVAVIRLSKQDVRAKSGTKLSKSKAKNLVVDFDQWFDSLPTDIQRGTKKRFGAREIIKLRGGLI